MQTKLRNGISALALGAALLAAGPSLAQSHHTGGGAPHAHASFGGGGSHFAPHVFAGHSFAHFGPADRHIWSGGHWSHGSHGGRFGWWWFAGGGWFFYPYAIYPYPDYVSDTAYYDDEDDGYYPPQAPGYAPGPSWYYCDNPRGYYPYVQSCRTQWHPVPSTPPGMQQGDNGPPGPANAAPRQMGPQDSGPDDDGDSGPPPPPPGH
jgi:hypothetical protein